MTTILTNISTLTTNEPVETLPVFDPIADNYVLLTVGWEGPRRIHHVSIHLRLHDGKIWVEADHTDREVVRQLVEAGVPTHDIVLAFYPPWKRHYTDFAVA